MDPLSELRDLYFNTTRMTIDRDMRRAIVLLKSLPLEEDRDRAAVYMSGLAEMRKEWNRGSAGRKEQRGKGKR